MRLRSLIAAAMLCVVALPLAAAEAIPASLAPMPAYGAGELMARFGLNGLFVRFGQSLAASPRLQGVGDERFLAAWEQGTLAAFASPALDQRLGDGLAATLAPAEIDGLENFLASPFGQKVALLEQTTQTVPPDRQIGVVAKGQTLYLAASDRRRAQFEELMGLTGADITFDMLGESLRGMAMGLRLATTSGELEVPWAEIDAEVGRQLSGMKPNLVDAAQAVLAYTYQSLDEAELEQYLDFLRAPATRKFYAAATLIIGDIVRETMFALGETVAERMQRVSV